MRAAVKAINNEVSVIAETMKRGAELRQSLEMGEGCEFITA